MQIVAAAAGIVFILYLLAIMPRMAYRPDKTSLEGWYYAHRGLHCKEKAIPENSMEAFRRAVQKGYGIELDVQLSKDGHPVVFHDYTLKRMCQAEGKVEDYTYEELQGFPLAGSDQRIPLFEDVLDMVEGRVPLIVELKLERADYSVCPPAAALLERYQGPYCIESFHPLALLWYRRKCPDVIRGQLSDHFTAGRTEPPLLTWCLRHLLFNFLTKPDFIAYHYKYAKAVSRRLCKNLYGALAVGWTIRRREDLEKLENEFDLFIFESFEA